MRDDVATTEIPLVEIIDRLLDRGVVLAGRAVISVAGVDLIELRLNVVLASVDALARSDRRIAEPR
ncbi:MAG TPA: gas vesicle protein GvpJ [Candidatus Limnocylindria bacterium]